MLRQAVSNLQSSLTRGLACACASRCYGGASASPSVVYAFGNGSQGALGCRATNDNYEPEPVSIPEDVAGIAAGHYHSLAWTPPGNLYSWGRNQELQLGRHADADDGHYGIDARPGLVPGLPSPVVGCAGSGVATLAVDADGRVLTFGKSKRGQLGLGRGTTAAATPEAVKGLSGVTSVSCGWGHALALTEDGDVYSWGYPAHNRLGDFYGQNSGQASEQQVLERCVWTPQRIAALAGIRGRQVCCSLDSSLVVAEDGRLFSFGDNSLAQLGRMRGQGAEGSAEDWLVRDADGAPLLVERVAAGLSHCLAITRPGEVVVWGWKHGLSEHPETLQLAASISGITAGPGAKIAAGRAHCLVAPSGAGDLLAFGNGQNGRLGTGTSQSSAAPEPVLGLEDVQIRQIACGHDHSLLLVQS